MKGDNSLQKKHQQLIRLAQKRRCLTPNGFNSITDYHHGAYDCDYVSPYSKYAGNLNASVMLILQDWCSDDFLSQPLNRNLIHYGIEPSFPTTRNLEQYLQRYFQLSVAQTYGTNLFPFVKPGAMAGNITIGELIQAAEQFTLEEIEIIAPKVAVCFGVATYNALLRAAKEQNRLKDTSLKPVKNLNQAIEQPFLLSFSSKVKVWICAQSHPGGLGRACRNKGKVDRVSQDWQQMAQFVKQIPFA
ncbi:TPA: hypothetical protein ACX6RS_001182 [Photobacterium damselae]|uniref:Uncharacterized protein n=2 Tax=Photobacterium damselae TaxID=38293 RepID=A0ACD3SVB7_PHODM|nr:hypothetical protein [Photobacterium damselae]MBA5682789.1 hypothetical protein [Photobacterium damselae subsp. damselae]MCG3812099.1 hypothetical protein [Photobacterium damselae]MDC4170466.1 hypothetical protein [Photobacterium damselae]NVH50684.1 hypothetical protein [Photobacterium damselae subsp. damselae]NVO82278.1 hypothetical protein [Photobacterium damselae subsp. damselae]